MGILSQGVDDRAPLGIKAGRDSYPIVLGMTIVP
jgi:hypothetical protein